MSRKKVLTLAACVLLTSCATSEKEVKFNFKSPITAVNDTVSNSTRDLENAASLSKGNETKKAKPVPDLIKVPNFEKLEPVNLKGDGIESGAKISLPSGEIQVSVENMPVYDFINFVFGKLLHLNYTISPEVSRIRQKVTLNMTSPMKPARFFSFVKEMLKSYQIDVTFKDGVFTITTLKRKTTKKFTAAKIIIGRELPQSLSGGESVTVILPLYYLKNSKFVSIARDFVKDGVVLKPFVFDDKTVIVSGTVSNVKEVLTLVKIFDRPYFTDKQFYILTLNYISTDQFLKEIDKIFKSMGIPVSQSPKDNALILVPLERKDRLFVVSPLTTWIDALMYWKEKLDTIDALGDEPQLFIYKPKNRSAEELLKVLNDIFSSSQGAVLADKKSEKPSETKKAKKTTAAVKSVNAKTFKATVDKERNTLIIMTYPSNYKKVLSILEKLDTQPKQVLVEVTIAEVTLTDQLQFGFEWYLKHSGSNLIGDLMTLGGLGIGGAGFNYSLVSSTGKLNLLVNAFAKKNLINIVSTPRIVVLDGKEASINIGTEVPVVSSETTAPDVTDSSTTPSILRNVQYRNTGVILRVKPVVTSDNMLTIDVSQELSEAQANNISSIDSPIILNRSIKTTLSLKSGETVLLGGLISRNDSNTDSKVPLLGDLPVVGNLFKVRTKGKNRTELIVLITPKIIENTENFNSLTDKLVKIFKNSIDSVK